VQWRNPKILTHLRFLEQSQHWSRDELANRQLVLLKELVAIAYHRAPHYREKLDEAGVGPQAIRHLDDIGKLPILEKQELLQAVDRIQIRDRAARKLFYSETSGSTGTPLVFYRDDDWDAWHNASVMRGYSWYGVHPSDRNGYLWGFNYSAAKRLKTNALDALQNRFRMFSYDDREIERFVRQLRRAKYLGGYSSMIYEVAKAINRNPRIEPLTNLQMIRGTSEKIFENYQAEAMQAFGRRIISEYGAAESGIIAFECPHGSMHVNLETCIVETVDQQILVTNLVSRSFPIIRYRLGDLVDYDGSSGCACGMAHPIIREVTGRIGQVIRGKTSSFPSLTLYYVFKNLAQRSIVLNYMATQDRAGKMELKIEQPIDPRERSCLEHELQKYFGHELEIDIADGVSLRSRNRKRRDFVSSIRED
jgi:phenylacetate-CoA ligase